MFCLLLFSKLTKCVLHAHTLPSPLPQVGPFMQKLMGKVMGGGLGGMGGMPGMSGGAGGGGWRGGGGDDDDIPDLDGDEMPDLVD